MQEVGQRRERLPRGLEGRIIDPARKYRLSREGGIPAAILNIQRGLTAPAFAGMRTPGNLRARLIS